MLIYKKSIIEERLLGIDIRDEVFSPYDWRKAEYIKHHGLNYLINVIYNEPFDATGIWTDINPKIILDKLFLQDSLTLHVSDYQYEGPQKYEVFEYGVLLRNYNELKAKFTAVFKEIGCEFIDDNHFLAPKEFYQDEYTVVSDWLKIRKGIETRKEIHTESLHLFWTSDGYPILEYDPAYSTQYKDIMQLTGTNILFSVSILSGKLKVRPVCRNQFSMIYRYISWQLPRSKGWSEYDPVFTRRPLLKHARGKLSIFLMQKGYNLVNGRFAGFPFASHGYEFEYNSEIGTIDYMENKVQKSMRGGKGLIKLLSFLGEDITPDEAKEILIKFESEIPSDGLEIISGKDIVTAYHYSSVWNPRRAREVMGDRYQSINIGTLGGSCMRHDYCKDYLQVYADSPNCKLLVRRDIDTGLIIARALLWETIDGKKLMDRIYGDEVSTKIFKDWARDNGYWRKRRQTSYDEYEWVKPDGTESNRYFQVQLIDTDTKIYVYDYQYPYMDTFKYINEDGTIGNGVTRNYGGSNVYLINNTDGTADACYDYALN